MSVAFAAPITGIEPTALAILSRCDWPGNVRELANLLERAFVLESTERITEHSLPHDLVSSSRPGTDHMLQSADRLTLARARESFEKGFIRRALARNRNNIRHTAKQLEVPRSTIYWKLESWGVPTDGCDPGE